MKNILEQVNVAFCSLALALEGQCGRAENDMDSLILKELICIRIGKEGSGGYNS